MTNRQGFTLIEIIIAVAIVAIMAGTIAPLAFKEMISAREDATEKELAGLNRALVQFYEDTGRFPGESEGLAALLEDPGVTGWSGPYLGGGQGDQLAELTSDAFHEDYVYDLNPDVSPGVADALVASGGADHSLGMGRLNRPWRLDRDEDDLVTLITVGQIDREKTLACQDEMQALAAAATAHWEDRLSFPAAVSDLSGHYLDPGMDNDAFIDPWNSPYLFFQSGGGGAPLVWNIRSAGPDRQDDGGGDDDLNLAVSSLPPGRRVTVRRLDIAQTVLNNDPGLVLTGVWNNDRAALGLDGSFALDGWGQSLAVNVNSRTIYSIGPDGNPVLVSDNVPAGVGP